MLHLPCFEIFVATELSDALYGKEKTVKSTNGVLKSVFPSQLIASPSHKKVGILDPKEFSPLYINETSKHFKETQVNKHHLNLASLRASQKQSYHLHGIMELETCILRSWTLVLYNLNFQV